MEREASKLGLRFDAIKPRADCPIFSKAITEDWSICWVIEDAEAYFGSPIEGRFEPPLELRSRQIHGRLAKFEPGEVLRIRFVVVPGFFNATGNFSASTNLRPQRSLISILRRVE